MNKFSPTVITYSASVEVKIYWCVLYSVYRVYSESLRSVNILQLYGILHPSLNNISLSVDQSSTIRHKTCVPHTH